MAVDASGGSLSLSRRLRRSRRLIVPEIVQTSSMDCGPASLKCLLEGFGIQVSYGRLREACQTDVDGTSMNTLEEVAIQLGLEAEQIMLPVDHLMLPESRALPAIAAVCHPSGITHFVVIWRIHARGQFVQVMDPATGRRWPRRQQLLREIYGHTMPVPAAAWREWTGTPEFLGALCRRLTSIGLPRRKTIRLVQDALKDEGWQSMATLDAAARMVNSLVRSGGLTPGRQAYRVIQAFFERGREAVITDSSTDAAMATKASMATDAATDAAMVTDISAVTDTSRGTDASRATDASSKTSATAVASPPGSPPGSLPAPVAMKAAGIIPAAYWSVQPAPRTSQGDEQLFLRGAVLVRALGRHPRKAAVAGDQVRTDSAQRADSAQKADAEALPLDAAHPESAPSKSTSTPSKAVPSKAAPSESVPLAAPSESVPLDTTPSESVPLDGAGHASLSPELRAALKEKPIRPGRELFGFLARDGFLSPMLLSAALAMASASVVIQALLFRGLFDLGRDLGLAGQRFEVMGAILIFAVALLLLELPIGTELLRLGRHIESRLRLAFMEKIPRLHDRYFQSRLTSDMAERSHSVHNLRLLPSLGGQFIRTSSELALTTGAIAWLYPSCGLIALITAVISVGFPLAVNPYLAERNLRVRNHNGALSRFYLDGLLGLVAVRAHGAERAVRREHEDLLVEWARAGLGFQAAVVVIEGMQSLIGFGLAAWLLFNYVAHGGDAGGVLLLVYWALNLPSLGQTIATLARQYPNQRSVMLRLLEPLGAPEGLSMDHEGSGMNPEGLNMDHGKLSMNEKSATEKELTRKDPCWRQLPAQVSNSEETCRKQVPVAQDVVQESAMPAAQESAMPAALESAMPAAWKPDMPAALESDMPAAWKPDKEKADRIDDPAYQTSALAILAASAQQQQGVTCRGISAQGASDPGISTQGASGPEISTQEISAQGISVRFEDMSVRVAGQTILEGINLAIEPGRHVAIVGRSGAGKSSLVGILLGWYRPASGRVLVDGSPLDADRIERLRRETAWIDPAVQLWNRSLIDNLYYGIEPDSGLPVGQAIRATGLHGVLGRLAYGFQTSLGEGGALVSGGEGQRVRLGRAMLRPGVRLVILDEPFRGLDHQQRQELLSNSRALWPKATLVCVTHDVGETGNFDQVIVMEEGRIVENGPPAELAKVRNSRYRSIMAVEDAVRKGFWSSTSWRRLRLEAGQLTEDAAQGEGEGEGVRQG